MELYSGVILAVPKHRYPVGTPGVLLDLWGDGWGAIEVDASAVGDNDSRPRVFDVRLDEIVDEATSAIAA